jgi:hypothetical protein
MQLRNVEDNLDRTVVDACGNPLPPCIVMERGEALDFWVARARPDRAQALSVRSPPYAARVCKKNEHCILKQIVASVLAPQTVSHIAL